MFLNRVTSLKQIKDKSWVDSVFFVLQKRESFFIYSIWQCLSSLTTFGFSGVIIFLKNTDMQLCDWNPWYVQVISVPVITVHEHNHDLRSLMRLQNRTHDLYVTISFRPREELQ